MHRASRGRCGIAWEVLITMVVRRMLINDISPHLFSFWTIVLNHTNDLCQRIQEARLSVDEWDHQKEIFSRSDDGSTVELDFSCFYLNRANRSGILKAGLIGGRNQAGKWRMDARFNRENLIHRIMRLSLAPARGPASPDVHQPAFQPAFSLTHTERERGRACQNPASVQN